MASRRDDPERARGAPPERTSSWTAEPEVGSASGGHLAPEVQPTGPLFETAETPPITRTAPTRDDILPRGRGIRRRSQPRRRVALRRVKRTLRHIDPLSIFKLSLFFYGIAVIFWLVIVAIIYSVINSMGLFDTIEEFSRGFALGWKVNITLFFVEKWALLIGLIFAVLGSLINLLLSFLYNVGADTIGGIEMTFVERDS